MTPVFLDFETYWDSDYTLSKMSQIEYVMDDRFETISCGIKVGGGDTVVYVGDEIGPALAEIDWDNTIAVAHNMAFDGLILAWRYGYTPALWACTLCMARPIHGKDVGGSLKYLSEYYGYQPKGMLQTKGRRLADLTPEEIAALRTYNVTDVDICHDLFKTFLPVTTPGELLLIDRTLRMALEPRLEADTVLLEHGLRAERARKEKALQRLSARLHMTPAMLRQELASTQKFAALLESWGVAVPTKPSPATGKPIPALAKTDYGMQDLLEHEDELVRTASELRLDVKSTILETRIESMLRVAAACDGKMPIILNYYGATNTGRWCLTPDHEVLTKQGWVRLDTWAGQEVMQWDSANASLTWCDSTIVTSFDVDEELIAFSGRHHKAIYTSEHRIPCRAHHSDAVVDVTASQLSSIQQRKMFISGFAKEGVEVQDVVLKLTIAMHADGHNVHDSKNNMVRFRFVRQRKIERIRTLLTEAGIPFSVTSYPSEPHVTVVLVRGKDAPQWLREAKKLPEYFYQLSGAQAEVVLRELPHWDGCISGPNSTSCTTKDKDAALKYSTLAHLCGWRAKITHVDRAASGWSDTYKVSVCPTNIYSARGDHARRVSYKGKVYCPTVDTGYFLCRRENSIFVTGNSGGGGLNQQNYPRVNPNQFKLTDVLRLSLKAPEGHQIVVADLAGIELRVNMHLWQVPYAMALYQADPDRADLYKAFAATLYQVPVEQVDKTMRQMGKISHLGLGYGSSAATFRRVAKTMGGVEVSQDEAEKIVNTWREAHQEVVQGWWKCTAALHAMYSGREMAIDPWGLCKTGKDCIVLPRGILRYTDLRQENDDNGKPNWVYGKGRYKSKIYSSKLDENLVQALSRYVLSDIMLAYAQTELGQAYPIVHCVHDELVVVAKDDDAQAVLDLLLTLMKTPPTWWPELVTSAEGSYAPRYGEAK